MIIYVEKIQQDNEVRKADKGYQNYWIK